METAGKTLEYKGYKGKVEFDTEDEIFVGEVLGVKDSLNFHGETLPEAEAMFRQSVDNYLALCKEIGKEPEKN